MACCVDGNDSIQNGEETHLFSLEPRAVECIKQVLGKRGSQPWLLSVEALAVQFFLQFLEAVQAINDESWAKATVFRLGSRDTD